jgi:hypothetical protein
MLLMTYQASPKAAMIDIHDYDYISQYPHCRLWSRPFGSPQHGALRSPLSKGKPTRGVSSPVGRF